MNTLFVLRQIGFILCAVVAVIIVIQLLTRNSIEGKQVINVYKEVKVYLTPASVSVPRKKLIFGSELQYCSKTTKNAEERTCGRTFPTKWTPYLKSLGLTDAQTDVITEEDDKKTMELKPKFVTAFSADHYNFAMNTLFRTLKRYLPTQKLIVYDLGLDKSQLSKLKTNEQVAELRSFNFSQYPGYVQNLIEYRWKPLILAEFLHEHKAIFYMDAHIQWSVSDWQKLLKQLACNKLNPNFCDQYPMMLLWNTGHSIFATTVQETFKYFHLDQDVAMSVEMGCAGFQLTFGTSDVRRNVLKWAVLCALEKDCMGPRGAKMICTFKKNDQFKTFANCHRYDQSVFNILLANRHDFNRTRYLYPFNILPEKPKQKAKSTLTL